MNTYTVTQYTHGITVAGEIPLSVLGAFCRQWAFLGYDLLYYGEDIKTALGNPTIIVSNAAEMAAWSSELGLPEVP